ncbi:MAG: AraC family transcriptional regulator [Bacteroidota bacterium]
MTLRYNDYKLQGFFALSDNFIQDSKDYDADKKLIHIHWNRNDYDVEMELDAVPYLLEPNQLTTTTYFHQAHFPVKNQHITTFSFNREFYCIRDHDHEVSCNGVLFFGTQETPIITLGKSEAHKFNLLYEVFLDEFNTIDNIQGEMLRMLLKRLIIKTTRLAKEQNINKELKESQIDIVRKFNVLVDMHFREKRQVNDYAELLFKSPKTLSNLFYKYNQKSPLQIIHERVILEAKRLLAYTDKTAKEVAYDLGFEEIASFHKLFKKVTTQTPQQFKSSTKVYKGKNEQVEGKS